MLNVVGEQPPWTGLVFWAIRNYQNRTDFEDIAQEALLAACISARKHATGLLGRCSLNRAVIKSAQWAASEYTRNQRGGSRCKELPTISLEVLLEEKAEEDWGVPLGTACNDFSLDVIERLWLEEAMAKIPKERRDILLLSARGYTEQEIADQRRLTRGQVRGKVFSGRKDLRAVLCGGNK